MQRRFVLVFRLERKERTKILATENDGLNGLSMLFAKLLTQTSSIFADVRTYWSPEAIKEATGWTATGEACNGIIHLINSGAAALDGTGACRDKDNNGVMKKWFDINDSDIENMLMRVKWAPAMRQCFRGGGFSSRFQLNASCPLR